MSNHGGATDMGRRPLLAGAMVTAMASAAEAASPQGGELPATAEGMPWTFPAVPGYGRVVALPDAPQQPDPALRYRVIFSLTQVARERGGTNPGLGRVARLLNLLGLGGVTPASGDVVAVFHGAATPAVVSDEVHRARFGVPNPNMELLRLLRECGVAVEVCGQALAEHSFRPGDAASEVTVTLSAQTSLLNRQLRGWAVLEG